MLLLNFGFRSSLAIFSCCSPSCCKKKMISSSRVHKLQQYFKKNHETEFTAERNQSGSDLCVQVHVDPSRSFPILRPDLNRCVVCSPRCVRERACNNGTSLCLRILARATVRGSFTRAKSIYIHMHRLFTFAFAKYMHQMVCIRVHVCVWVSVALKLSSSEA